MTSEDSREAPAETPQANVPKSEAVTRRLRSTPPPAPSPVAAPVTIPSLPPLERIDGSSRTKRGIVLAVILGSATLLLVLAYSLGRTKPAGVGEATLPPAQPAAERAPAPAVASVAPPPPSAPTAGAPPSDGVASHASKARKAQRPKADDLF
jgi:hypothetical protein